ncbi:cationic amino acid transporter, partial [Haloferax sp. BAB-2207]
MSDEVGLPEAVSMAIGGMVGGGIFAVLGVVAGAAGTLAWAAF